MTQKKIGESKLNMNRNEHDGICRICGFIFSVKLIPIKNIIIPKVIIKN